MAWMLALAAKCPSTARRANFLALAWELVLVLTKRSWVDMGSSKNRRPCGDTLRMPAGSRLGKARVDNPIKQSHAQPMGLGHSSTTSTHHDEALSRRGARELEEWQRLGAILDRSGTQGLVDDWMMGEAYGLPPIIVGRQLMEWLRTQLEPNSMADIDRLDAILYIRNPSRLRGVFFQESLAQTVRGGPVNLRALRWAQFIHQEDPECAAAALVDGQWARQAFWSTTYRSTILPCALPSNHGAISVFLEHAWKDAWRHREDSDTSGLGLVALWSVLRKRMGREEAKLLWDACRAWSDLVPREVAMDLRRAAIGGQAQEKEQDEGRTRM